MNVHAVRADARANRRRLIEAAYAILREHGPDVEMKEIAERAGVGIGTIYRNFPTKGDLIAAIVFAAADEMMCGLADADHLADTDPTAAVRALFETGFGLVDRYGDLMMTLMHGGHVPDTCRDRIAEFDKAALVRSILQKGIDTGVLRADLDPAIAAGAIHATFAPWNYQALRATRTHQEIVDAAIDLFLRGAHACPAAASMTEPHLQEGAARE